MRRRVGLAVIDGGSWATTYRADSIPRFTCAPQIRMPRITFPIFQSNVKAVARAMSDDRVFAGDCSL